MDRTQLSKKWLFASALVAVFIAFAYGVSLSQETIKLGFFAPMTGPVALAGKESEMGVKFAVEEINAAGGINGRKIDLTVYDDRLDAKEAAAIATRLVERDKVIAVVGGSFSSTLLAAAPILNDGKVPTLIAYSNAFYLVKDKPYMFRWAFVADIQGYGMAYYAIKDLGLKRFAMLTMDNEYGRGISRGFEEGVKEWGGEIVYRKIFPLGEKEFRAVLTAIKPLNVDAIHSTGFDISLANTAIQGKELGIFPKAKFLTGCATSGLAFFTTMTEKGIDIYSSHEFLSGVPEPAMKTYLDKWEKKYGSRVVGHEAGLVYETTIILAEAIKEAIKKGDLSREGIRKALAETPGFKSLIGPFMRFTPDRELMRPVAVGKYDVDNKIHNLVKMIDDPKIIDPKKWFAYYP